jgi:hypothetical protein
MNAEKALDERAGTVGGLFAENLIDELELLLNGKIRPKQT